VSAELGRRIIVVGDSGSGKSTLGAELARRLGIELIELDALHWAAGWVEVDLDVFRERVRRAVGADAWVLVGNYRSQQSHISWPRAQSIVWLDLPLWRTIPRLLARSFRRWRSGEELWGGNRERFWSQLRIWEPEASLVGWNLKTRRSRRRDFEAAMRDPAHAAVRFHRLCSPLQIRQWLRQLSRSAEE
jgi:adenylate kinase family enzyme